MNPLCMGRFWLFFFSLSERQLGGCRYILRLIHLNQDSRGKIIFLNLWLPMHYTCLQFELNTEFTWVVGT